MLAASAASQEDPRPQDPAPPAAAAAAPADDASDKAQTQSTEPRETRALVTPDGSRFLLVRDMQQRHIHWALACWIDGRDDPPGFSGLTLTAVRASLGGTWRTGSRDADAERAAIRALDEAWQLKMREPANADNNKALLEHDKRAAELGDARTFRRVLAALPAHRVELLERGGVAVFTLTTIEPALEAVARMVLERREDQALRGLARAWLPSVMRRAEEHARRPERRVHAELLALLAPNSPAVEQLEPPPMAAPKRADALAAWESSQHPQRTANVLYGALDLDRTEAMLREVFAATSLPAPTDGAQTAIRPPRALRRSVVPGMPAASVSIAWPLPADIGPGTLLAATSWLAGDEGGRLRWLLRKKRPQLEVEAVAPWPEGARPALLRIDARDPKGVQGLADDLVAACRKAATEQLSDGNYYQARLAAQRAWARATTDPRQVAVRLAELELAWPNIPFSAEMPQLTETRALVDALKRTFAGAPTVVEARR